MPKIKELSNKKLQDYLDAYEAESAIFPANKDYKKKSQLIKEALEQRKINGFDVKDKKVGAIARALKLFKRTHKE